MDDKPESFLEIIVHDIKLEPGLTGLCAGYEQGVWRHESFASHLMEWLLEFALNWSEYEKIRGSNATALMRRAANVVYNSEKYSKRGEFGELLLHVAMRQVFDTEPAISKIYYKSAVNDTVKGFDAVHVVVNGNEIELWIGEAKFYEDINDAITDVSKELVEHTKRDYLRNEFALITNKLDDKWSHSEHLKKLLSPNTSLDEVFSRICIPVLLTYNSNAIANHISMSDEYKKAIEEELLCFYDKFTKRDLPKSLRIHLLLVPLGNKKLLVDELNKKLKAMQTI
ncbi:MAG: DUF1837 domain-containing protein [Nitrospirae bacterium]|nr:DUF1837 domain-containing protein [Nitrospirota bacterium]